MFPLPEDLETAVLAAGQQPKDAFFYVFNRGIANDGEPSFETLDYANVEGKNDDAKMRHGSRSRSAA